jgi:hypothetical protein
MFALPRINYYVAIGLPGSFRKLDAPVLVQGKLAWALKTTSYFGLWYFFNIFVCAPWPVLNLLPPGPL